MFEQHIKAAALAVLTEDLAPGRAAVLAEKIAKTAGTRINEVVLGADGTTAAPTRAAPRPSAAAPAVRRGPGRPRKVAAAAASGTAAAPAAARKANPKLQLAARVRHARRRLLENNARPGDAALVSKADAKLAKVAAKSRGATAGRTRAPRNGVQPHAPSADAPAPPPPA